MVLIELFAGILVGTEIATDLLWPLEATYFSETDADALLVIRTNFPLAQDLGNVYDITDDALHAIADKHPHALLAVLGGPPCVDVSRLSAGRVGVTGARSSLVSEFQRVWETLVLAAPNRCVALLENTLMDPKDQATYDNVFPLATHSPTPNLPPPIPLTYP